MKLTRAALLAAATTAAAFIPGAALAATGGGVYLSGSALYFAIGGLIWYAADKIIDLLPIRENTLVQFIRTVINELLGKKRP